MIWFIIAVLCWCWFWGTIVTSAAVLDEVEAVPEGKEYALFLLFCGAWPIAVPVAFAIMVKENRK